MFLNRRRRRLTNNLIYYAVAYFLSRRTDGFLSFSFSPAGSCVFFLSVIIYRKSFRFLQCIQMIRAKLIFFFTTFDKCGSDSI